MKNIKYIVYLRIRTLNTNISNTALSKTSRIHTFYFVKQDVEDIVTEQIGLSNVILP